jgi:catechol 2,3-dioxygenase
LYATGASSTAADARMLSRMDSSWFSSVALTGVVLRVGDLGRVAAFYEAVLGLGRAAMDAGGVALRTARGAPLVVLEPADRAAARPRGAAGLFHVAFLYDDRPALAAALRRVIDARIPIGSADHGVSEAIYLSDPEGNGIELYVDRPRDRWPPAQPDGQVAMVTDPLDVDALLAVSAPTAGPPARIGHVHLSVVDLVHAERFYGDFLGFAVTQRTYPGALFLSRDGYHHHLGANTWRSTISLAATDELEGVATRLAGAGHPFQRAGDTIDTHDLDGIAVRISSL